MTVDVEIKADAAIAELRRIRGAYTPTTMLNAIGDRLLFWIDENFRRTGIEVPWPPLRPNTIAGRRRGSSQPLQDTGRLRQSANKQVVGDAVRVGYASLIAPFHHFGTSPYTIRPVRARALRFQTVEGTVFTKRVRHPGLPRRQLIPSQKLGGELARQEADAIVERASRGQG